MAYLTPTQVQCPVCRQPFTAQLEQIIDVGSDPAGKGRLLSGRLNVVACPGCGSAGMLATPLLYHDPEHELLLVYAPMELNLTQEQREQLIGSLTRGLMSRIPAEARKGYLFNPQTALTFDGLVERVLEAEGVPPEFLEAQRKRGQLLSRLLAATEVELESLAKVHDAELDEIFFRIIAVAIETAQGAGRKEEVNKLVLLRNRLLPLASWSRQRGITPQLLDDQQARTDLLERFLTAGEDQWEVLAQEHDQLLDYLFFQLLSATAAAAQQGGQEEVAAQLLKLRDRLLELTSAGREIKASQGAVEELKAAADAAGGLSREILLEQILDAEGEAAVEALAVAGSPLLDYSFFILMADKIDAAAKRGDRQEAGRLGQLREKLVTLTETWEKAMAAQAAKIDRQIVDMLQAEDRDKAIERLAPELDEVFLSMLAGRVASARQAGQEETAERLEQLLDQILAQIRASAPPEIQLINDLMELEDEAAIQQALDSRRDVLTPTALAAMEQILEDMRAGGRDAFAGRLETIVELAKKVVG